MIRVIEFNDDLFNKINKLTKGKIGESIYVTNIELISELLTYKGNKDFPIANEKIAIKNILEFLSFIDTHNKIDKDNTVLLPRDTIETYFSRNTYKKYLDILSKLNVITNIPHADGTFYKFDKERKEKGVCKKFKLHNSYLYNEDLCVVIIEEERIKMKLENEIEGLDDKYIKTISKINIDVIKAIEAEINYFNEKNIDINILKKRISNLLYSNRRRFIKKGKNVDRIYHSFSNVSRVSRKHFNIKFHELDIVNTQPLILASYLKNNNFHYDEKYKSDCEVGFFYEQFYDLCEEKNDEEFIRKFIKEKIYSNLFFGFFEKNEVNNRFKELYPLTWLSLKEIHSTDISLAFRLQNLEASIFNKLIPKKSKHYFTLFDAIYFDNYSDKIDLKKRLEKEFDKLGVKVTVK